MLQLCIFWLTMAKALATRCEILQPVGVEFTASIPDSSMTTNSQINKWHGPAQGRLNNYQHKSETSRGVGAWCAAKDDGLIYRYLQIDLGTVRRIGRIGTQGRNVSTSSQWVKNYNISYSTKGIVFSGIKSGNAFKLFTANTDANSIVYNDLASSNGQPLMARYIRVLPVEFRTNICMRVELYECLASQPACPPGFGLSADNVTCTDLNECDLEPALCSQKCLNTNGSYTCSCKDGYRLQSDNTTCNNIDECSENRSGCSQICIDNDGSFECKCRNGYQLQSDAKTCLDKNECALGIDECSQNCHNTEGSYTCSCRAGYRLYSDGKYCININECKEGTSGCTQICTDSYGSFKCTCFDGYQLQNDGKTCFDIDECASNKGGCSHTCVNLNGTYLCACPPGYEVDSSTQKVCQDKNECKIANGGCDHVCTNTDGSYECSCNSGFQLKSNRRECEDIDECTDGTAQCDLNSTTCTNFMPGFKCECKPGYVPLKNQNNTECEAKTCGALTKAPGTNVSPASCLIDRGNTVGDICTFSCQAGYELPSDTNTLVCESSSLWNGSIIRCQKLRCPRLAVPANGYLSPSTCGTVGDLYEHTCNYLCNSGYQISGVSRKTCQSNGQWDSQEEPTCGKVFPPPTIQCPPHVRVNLSTGASTSDVSALLGSPVTNQPMGAITIKPLKYNTSKVFPAGRTILTYTVANPSGQTANCTTLISVRDLEAPLVSYCPSNIYSLIPNKEASTVVDWTAPTFTDNVGVVHVEVFPPYSPGDTFQPGSVSMTYTAKDAENNKKECKFSIIVRRQECRQPSDPDNGSLDCRNFGNGKFCTITCNQSKKTFKFMFGFFVSCEGNEVPDCVDYTSLPAGGSCSTGYVPQSGGFVNDTCVKCPRGMYYNKSSSTCEKCPVGFISTAEGSFKCEACPSMKSTEGEGSKICIEQCGVGKFSQTGLDLLGSLSPCMPCPSDTYQDMVGQTSCQQCPNGTRTHSTESKSPDDCGYSPVITQFGPNPINAAQGQQVQFECYGKGKPLPTFYIEKVEGLERLPTRQYIYDEDKNLIGLRYIITAATGDETGAYRCTLVNPFGEDTEYLTVTVQVDYITGKRRRRRRYLRQLLRI